MKNKIIKFLYKIFSFLADKTNGWKIFVSPKLFFGALVVSVTAISASSCAPKSDNTETSETIVCYMIDFSDDEYDTESDDEWCKVCYGVYKIEENQN